MDHVEQQELPKGKDKRRKKEEKKKKKKREKRRGEKHAKEKKRKRKRQRQPQDHQRREQTAENQGINNRAETSYDVVDNGDKSPTNRSCRLRDGAPVQYEEHQQHSQEQSRMRDVVDDNGRDESTPTWDLAEVVMQEQHPLAGRDETQPQERNQTLPMTDDPSTGEDLEPSEAIPVSLAEVHEKSTEATVSAPTVVSHKQLPTTVSDDPAAEENDQQQTGFGHVSVEEKNIDDTVVGEQSTIDQVVEEEETAVNPVSTNLVDKKLPPATADSTTEVQHNRLYPSRIRSSHPLQQRSRKDIADIPNKEEPKQNSLDTIKKQSSIQEKRQRRPAEYYDNLYGFHIAETCATFGFAVSNIQFISNNENEEGGFDPYIVTCAQADSDNDYIEVWNMSTGECHSIVLEAHHKLDPCQISFLPVIPYMLVVLAHSTIDDGNSILQYYDLRLLGQQQQSQEEHQGIGNDSSYQQQPHTQWQPLLSWDQATEDLRRIVCYSVAPSGKLMACMHREEVSLWEYGDNTESGETMQTTYHCITHWKHTIPSWRPLSISIAISSKSSSTSTVDDYYIVVPGNSGESFQVWTVTNKPPIASDDADHYSKDQSVRSLTTVNDTPTTISIGPSDLTSIRNCQIFNHAPSSNSTTRTYVAVAAHSKLARNLQIRILRYPGGSHIRTIEAPLAKSSSTTNWRFRKLIVSLDGNRIGCIISSNDRSNRRYHLYVFNVYGGKLVYSNTEIRGKIRSVQFVDMCGDCVLVSIANKSHDDETDEGYEYGQNSVTFRTFRCCS